MLDEPARITGTPLDRIKLTSGGARNRRWVAAKAALGPGRLRSSGRTRRAAGQAAAAPIPGSARTAPPPSPRQAAFAARPAR